MSSDASVLGTSSSEMTRISEAIDTKASNVLDKLISVSSASEEMAATSQEISSNCNLAAASSEQSMAMAHDGMLSVENTVNEIRAHSQKTKEDAQLILALDKRHRKSTPLLQPSTRLHLKPIFWHSMLLLKLPVQENTERDLLSWPMKSELWL